MGPPQVIFRKTVFAFNRFARLSKSDNRAEESIYATKISYPHDKPELLTLPTSYMHADKRRYTTINEGRKRTLFMMSVYDYIPS